MIHHAAFLEGSSGGAGWAERAGNASGAGSQAEQGRGPAAAPISPGRAAGANGSRLGDALSAGRVSGVGHRPLPSGDADPARSDGGTQRPCFWPHAADLQRVPEVERVGKAFDQAAALCPVYEVEWNEEQLLRLYDCASGVRRWLRYRIDRMVSHEELACILGVSGWLMERACVLGFAKMRERFEAEQKAGGK